MSVWIDEEGMIVRPAEPAFAPRECPRDRLPHPGLDGLGCRGERGIRVDDPVDPEDLVSTRVALHGFGELDQRVLQSEHAPLPRGARLEQPDERVSDLFDAEGAAALGDNAIAIGRSANAFNFNSTAVGANASASGGGSTALGQGSNSQGTQSVAVGQGAQSLATHSTAIGMGAVASGIDTFPQCFPGSRLRAIARS